MGLAQADGITELQLREHGSILTRLLQAGEHASRVGGPGFWRKRTAHATWDET